jgi:hypothetical protein
MTALFFFIVFLAQSRPHDPYHYQENYQRWEQQQQEQFREEQRHYQQQEQQRDGWRRRREPAPGWEPDDEGE